MTYNSAHTGPEIDAAVQLLGQIQEARDSTSQDLSDVRGLAAQVKIDASQVSAQTETVTVKASQVTSDAVAVEQARSDVVSAAAIADDARDAAVMSAASAQESQSAASASEQAAAQSQLAAGLSEQISAESAFQATSAAEQVEADRIAAAASAVSAAASAQNAEAVVTGGTASVTPSPGLIPLADSLGKINADWLPDDVARANSVQAAIEAASEAADMAATAELRTASFLPTSRGSPTVRGDGSPLQIGDRYFNSLTQTEYIYKERGWTENESIDVINRIISPNDSTLGAALIPYDGTTVGAQMLLSRTFASIIDAKEYDGTASRIVLTQSGCAGDFKRRPFEDGDTDDGGTKLVSANGLWTLERDFKGCVYPQWFGAAGDGRVNDTEAVRAACKVASVLGLTVSFEGLKRVLIDADARIIANCTLNGCGVTIAAHNGIALEPSHSTVKRMFIIKDPNLPQQSISLEQTEMFEGQTQLTVPESVGNGMLVVKSDKRIGSRTTAPDVPLYFYISHSINRGGVLNYPVKTDLTNCSISCLFMPSPQTWIEVKGFTADESTYNNQCLFRVERGLTKIHQNAIQPNGKNTMTKSINYLFWHLNAVNVILEDNVISGQGSSGDSTYGIVFNNCCDVTMSRLYGRGRNTWGVMESDNVNGVYVKDCNLNRLDVHQGMHNFFVDGGTCYGNGVQYGWGSGILEVRGLRIIGNTSQVAARRDYDGNFDGAIRIIDPIINYQRQTPNANGVAPLIPIFNAGALGGAVSTKACESLEIINACCLHAGSKDVIQVKPFNFDVVDGAVGVALPNNIIIDRIYSPKGRVVFSMACRYDRFVANSSDNVRVEVSNVFARPYRSEATLYRTSSPASYKTPSATFEFRFKNVTGYTQYCGMPGAKIYLDSCEVSHIKTYVSGSSSQRIMISNSEIVETTAADAGNVVGEIGAASDEITLHNVKVRSSCDLSFVDAAHGVLHLPGVSATLPSGATASTFFTGWKSTAFQ